MAEEGKDPKMVSAACYASAFFPVIGLVVPLSAGHFSKSDFVKCHSSQAFMLSAISYAFIIIFTALFSVILFAVQTSSPESLVPFSILFGLILAFWALVHFVLCAFMTYNAYTGKFFSLPLIGVICRMR